MASPLGAVYSGIDTAKRKAARFVEDLATAGPQEMLRQFVVDRNNAAGVASDKLGALYKDQQGKPTFDPNQWSPTARAVHDELVDEATGVVMGATAWHGTHAGNIVKFDPKKIGTGEGAQVYGEGTYLAGAKPVATEYRRQVPARHLVRRMSDDAQQGFDTDEVYRSVMTDPSIPRDQKRFIAALRKDDWLGFDYPHEAVKEMVRRPHEWDLSPQTIKATENLGHLYKIDLPDQHIANMLDWDVPMGQQPDVMGKIISGSNDPDKVILRQALDEFNRRQTGNPRQLGGAAIVNGVIDKAPTISAEKVMARQMSDALRDSGIPGTKYLDAGSRRGSIGHGTSNFVVYPGMEDIMTIQERNGMPINPNSWGGY